MPIQPNARRVVVTGLGIVSCIGNDADEVMASLKAGKSGITFSEEYAAKGFRSQVYGKPNINLQEKLTAACSVSWARLRPIPTCRWNKLSLTRA